MPFPLKCLAYLYIKIFSSISQAAMFNYQRVVPSAVEVVGLPLAALSKLIVAELARHLKGPKEVQPCW
jgi:hypothetical protein